MKVNKLVTVLLVAASMLTITACSSTDELAKAEKKNDKSITDRAVKCQETGSRLRSRC